MISGNLKVFSVGADWFYREMGEQGIEIYKIDWTPPPEIPEDIARILSAIKG